MEPKTIVPMYVQPNTKDEKGRRLAKGKLKHGLTILKSEGVQKEFIMREALAGDLFAAEERVPPTQSLKFNAAIWARTMVSIGTFEGPFIVEMFEMLKQEDYAILRDAQLELDISGE